ncbi:hypothetical protein SCUCBS95973_003070 [Sporothrix curviconia]|uniref:Uncharacterized protein n=1 Tax=Sporothrix curviconia TaxID=1260050 RepID=A0ABP0BCL0_9PEZI
MPRFSAAALLGLAATAQAASSLGEIKHVIMMMMENRSLQHYFGTMAGIRGFADPNVQINPSNNLPIWYQPVSSLTDEAEYLLPYWLNYENTEEGYNKSQCLCAGANNWIPTHQAMNYGANDQWAVIDDPQAWGYFKRQDIAYHFALAESYTLADMYHAAIMSNTDPNRWYWQSGTINVPGGKTPIGSGGVVLDDNQSNGCVATNLDCLPLQWPAFAQKLDEAGVDWRSYQQSYNWATNNGLFYFEAFQNAATNSSLYERGLAFDGDNSLESFKAAAANGTLPEVSWCFPPGNLQEHPPYTPQDGAWWINEIVNATINGPNYNDTVILLNWDEAGGWGDAVMPLVSPNGTADGLASAAFMANFLNKKPQTARPSSAHSCQRFHPCPPSPHVSSLLPSRAILLLFPRRKVRPGPFRRKLPHTARPVGSSTSLQTTMGRQDRQCRRQDCFLSEEDEMAETIVLTLDDGDETEWPGPHTDGKDVLAKEDSFTEDPLTEEELEEPFTEDKVVSKDTAYCRKKAARNRAAGKYKCPACVEMPPFGSKSHLDQHIRSKRHIKREAALKDA